MENGKGPMADGWLLWSPTHRTKTKTSDGWGTQAVKEQDGRWKRPTADGWHLWSPTHRTKTKTSDGHPAGLAKIRLIAAKRPGDDRGVSFR
jgi:hypothetical protein